METFFLKFFANSLINFASLSDSQLINKIFLLIAIFNSSSDLPTPEKTIFFGLMPALRAFNSSPPDTTSAPAPSLPKILKIFVLLLDFAAKHIKGLVFLNVFTKFK